MSSGSSTSSSSSWAKYGYLAGGIAAAGAIIGGISIAFHYAKQAEKKANARKELQHSIEHNFSSKKTQILEALWSSEDNEGGFDLPQLEGIHSRFSAILPNKDKGYLRQSEFSSLIEKVGVESKAEGLVFKFFDLSKDNRVDFSEFVAALNLLKNGSQRDLVERLFRVSDADGSHTLSASELVNLFSLFFPPHNQSASKIGTPAQLVESILEQGDENHDHTLSLKEFLHLADQPEFELKMHAGSFLYRLLKLFNVPKN